MTAMKVGAGLLLSTCLASAQFGWLHHAKRAVEDKDPVEIGALGVVLKKTANSFVLQDVDTRVITFRLADSTQYYHGAKWLRPSQLKHGAVVRVKATSDNDGNLT